MLRSNHRLAVLLLASAAGSLLGHESFAAAAADGAEPGASTLEELIVTARRREENVQTVPVAATAVTGEDLQRRGVTSVVDLAVTTPSLITTSVFGSTHANFTLRSQSADNASSGNDQPVEVYLADVPVLQASLASFYDLASVQVLRGPQGTLFGRAANGGAVILSPTRPGDAFEGYVTGQIGNLNDRELEGAVTIPILDDMLSVRLAANIVRRKGYTKVLNLNNLDLDDKHSNDFRISVAFTPTSWFRNDFVYEDVDVDQNASSNLLYSLVPGGLVSQIYNPTHPVFGGLFTALLAQNPDLAAIPGFAGGLQTYFDTTHRQLGPRKMYRSESADLLRFNNQQHYALNTARFELGWATLKHTFGYQYDRRLQGFLADDTPFHIIGPASNGPHLPELLVFQRHQYTNEVQLLGTAWDGKWDWIVGGFDLHMKDELPGNTFSGSLLSLIIPVVPSQPYSFDKTSKAIFTQHTFRFTDRLSVTGGYRRTWDENDITQYGFQNPVNLRGTYVGPTTCAGTNVPASLSAPECVDNVREQKSTGDNWTVSADYKVNDEVFTYISATKGYQAGGFTGSTIPAFAQFRPAKIKQYEFGLKTEHRFGDVLTRLNLAIYQHDLKDKQVSSQLFNPILQAPENVTVNVDKARVRGFEAEGLAVFNRYFRLSAFANYTDAKYLEFTLPIFGVNPANPGVLTTIGETDNSDNPFQNIPKYQVGATGTVTLPTPERLGRMDLSVTYYRQAKVPFVPDVKIEPDAFSEAYDLVNAQFQWSDMFQRPLDLTIFVKNAFDKYYLRGGIGINSTLGYTLATASEPRTFGARLRYRFGGGR